MAAARLGDTDVRAIPLAKAALYVGAKLRMERAGAAPQRVTLAGAFEAKTSSATRSTSSIRRS